MWCLSSISSSLFLSTPSARRATFYPSSKAPAVMQISIHALREEGDVSCSLSGWLLYNFYPRPPRGGRPHFLYGSSSQQLFLSTPSARRATRTTAHPFSPARDFYPRPPRGGRPVTQSIFSPPCYFYPRPPRGGRPILRSAVLAAKGISIHALREEGDLTYSLSLVWPK